jgi:hypothetical protein
MEIIARVVPRASQSHLAPELDGIVKPVRRKRFDVHLDGRSQNRRSIVTELRTADRTLDPSELCERQLPTRSRSHVDPF